MEKTNKLAYLLEVKAGFTKNLAFLFIGLPISLAIGGIYLIRSSGPKAVIESSSIWDVPFIHLLDMFILIASIFCLTPATIILVFVMPVYLSSSDQSKLGGTGGLIKITLIFFVLSSVALFSSLYLI